MTIAQAIKTAAYLKRKGYKEIRRNRKGRTTYVTFQGTSNKITIIADGGREAKRND